MEAVRVAEKLYPGQHRKDTADFASAGGGTVRRLCLIASVLRV